MASMTTHKYSPCSNNKENESCNGKRVGTIKSNSVGSGFDRAKQDAINQQRKIRLTQVRQQSKEIASQIRENVRSEEKKQLDKMNQVKRDEMSNWRQKQIGNVEKNYQSCLKNVGEAHVAAERENEKQRKIDEQKERNRKMALKRGKIAAQKLNPNLKLDKSKPKKVENKSPKASALKNVESSYDSDVSISSDSSSDSSNSSVCSVILADTRKSRFDTKSSGSSTQNKMGGSPKRSPLKVKWSTKTPEYDASRFDSINSSNATDVSLTDSPLSGEPPVITTVSELLQKSKSSSNLHIAKTYKLTKSPTKVNRSPIKSVQKRADSKSTTTTISSRINKTPTKNVSKPTTKPIQRKHFVPEFVKAKGSSIHDGGESSTQTSAALRQRVQFYDHFNRFSKEYDGTVRLEEEVQPKIPPNAWQEAMREIHAKKAMSRSMADTRKLDANRSKCGLEMEPARIEYDSIARDMQKMLRDERLAKNFRQSKEILSESRLLSESNFSLDKFNGSDNSFLLDFVTARTNKICDDIERCRKESGKQTSQSKIDGLHSLLNKVNSLRRILFEEIKNSGENGIDASEILNEISRVEQEQNKIMTGKSSPLETNGNPNRKRERMLSERERILKMKENCIDEKVRELYMREKEIEQKKKLAKANQNENKIGAGAIAVRQNGVETSCNDIPVKIVINVNKNDKTNVNSTDILVNDVKWKDRLKKPQESIERVPVTNGTGKVYPKTPALKTKTVTIERRQFDSASQSTSLTAYMSPPEQIHTQLSKALQRSAIAATLNTQLNSENVPQINDKELLHYVIRLLGMSRTSIEQLNMSTISSVQTPNSSIVNISTNQKFTTSSTSTPVSVSSSCSMEQTESIELNKMEQLKRFLAGNQNLIRGSESQQLVNNWDNILSKKQDEPTSKAEPAKPMSTEDESSKINQVDSQEQVGKTDLIAKYDELAANCQKRIINLDSMISKVREEKRKILENTLSSGSLIMSQKENLTEYKDLPGDQQRLQQNNDDLSLPLSDSKSTNAPSSEFSSTSGTAAETQSSNGNRVNLTATRNREFGESKDSGVGISRPVTSSDYRESPDLRQAGKSSDSDANKKLLSLALRESRQNDQFEPLLKDIPKISYRLGTEPESGARIEPEYPNPSINKEKCSKPPPTALTRYSPHMEDDLPHELSTITEVDTPVTSRLNAIDLTTANDPAGRHNNSLKNLTETEMMKFLYNQFPNFRDYIMANGNPSFLSTGSINESTDITAGASVILGEKLEKLLEVDIQDEAFKYKRFSSSTHTNSADNTKNTEYCDIPPRRNSNDISDNSSLADILSQLKARNIIDPSNEEVSGDEGSFKDLLKVPTNKRKLEHSKSSTDAQSDSLSEILERDLNSIGLTWASTIMRKSKEISSSSSTDSLSNADKLRRSPQKHSSPSKLRNTAKRTATVAPLPKNMDKTSNTCESFIDENLTLDDTTRNTGEPMKSMNLKEFLARELLKHSSMSSSSTNSSLASIFLKSFLEPAQNSGKLDESPINRGSDKQRTSTPVQNNNESKGDSKMESTIKSSSVVRNIANENEITIKPSNDLSKFFSGESHLSSVKSSATDSASTSGSSDERYRRS